jgi:oligopeptidase A
LPAALLEKVKRARNFQAAMAFMRQLSFGKLDLGLHLTGSGEGDPDEWEEALARDYSIPTHSRRSKMLRRFSHLFGSPTGYAGGYYSYKWSEVLDAHVFERFRKEGILNAELGESFREKILAPGNSAPARELYRDFMGSDPDETALLRRCGIWRATRAGDSSQNSGDRSQAWSGER